MFAVREFYEWSVERINRPNKSKFQVTFRNAIAELLSSSSPYCHTSSLTKKYTKQDLYKPSGIPFFSSR